MIKKILALLLTLCMLTSICGCGTQDTISDIPSDTTATEITRSQTEEKTNNTESKTSAPTTTTSSQTQVVVQPTPQPSPQQQHTHSYITTIKSATCTEQGYTTYTCSCGNTYNADFVTPSHKYTNYKCSVCGTIDKEHTFDYLVNWIIINGETKGGQTELACTSNGFDHKIIYQAQDNTIQFISSRVFEGEHYFTGITIQESLDECVYAFFCTELPSKIMSFSFGGIIKSNSYTTDSPITYIDFASDMGWHFENSLLEFPRLYVAYTLLGTEDILCGESGSFGNAGIKLTDLGFVSIEY